MSRSLPPTLPSSLSQLCNSNPPNICACVCALTHQFLIQRSPHPPPTRCPRRRYISAQKRTRRRHVHAKGMGRSRDPKVPAGFRRAGGCVRQVRPVESEHLKRRSDWKTYSLYHATHLSLSVLGRAQKGGGSWLVGWLVVCLLVWEKDLCME